MVNFMVMLMQLVPMIKSNNNVYHMIIIRLQVLIIIDALFLIIVQLGQCVNVILMI